MKLLPRKLPGENDWKLLVILMIPKLQCYRNRFSSKLISSWYVEVLEKQSNKKNPSNATKFRELTSDEFSRFCCPCYILLQDSVYALHSGLVTDIRNREKTTLNIQFWLWFYVFFFSVCFQIY